MTGCVPLYRLIAWSLTISQYRGGAFRVANHNRWHIVVTGPQLIEELKKAPDDVLSFNDAIVEVSLRSLGSGAVANATLVRRVYN